MMLPLRRVLDFGDSDRRALLSTRHVEADDLLVRINEGPFEPPKEVVEKYEDLQLGKLHSWADA